MGKRLYVGNIPYQTAEAQLRTLFEPAIDQLHGKEFGGRPLTVSEARERQR